MINENGISTLRVGLVIAVVIVLCVSQGLLAQSCDCNEFLYLNEVGGGGRVHKYEVQADGSLDEINPSGPWYPNGGVSELPRPHGLGTDINGFIYIGTSLNGGNQSIRRLECNGNIALASDFSIPNGNGSFNIVSIGNSLFFNRLGVSQVIQYDVCSEQEVNSVCFDGNTTLDWGLYVDPFTEVFYAATSFGTTNSRVYRFTIDDFGSGTCVPPLIATDDGIVNPGDNELPQQNLFGITTDEFGNMYIVEKKDQLQGGAGTRQARILKYDSDGNFVAATPLDVIDDPANDPQGWFDAIGIVYSRTSNLLYTSQVDPDESCVFTFNTDLVPQGEVVPAPGAGSGAGKGIALRVECCPAAGSTMVNQTVCYDGVNPETVFLQDLSGCDGTVCEASWSPVMTNPNFAFDPCNLTLTVNGTGCARYQLATGVGTNPTCPNSIILVEVCSVLPPTAAGTAIPATCNPGSDTPNDDAQISMVSIANGNRIGIVAGTNYDAFNGPDYTAATMLGGATTFNFMDLSIETDYVVRVFNGSDVCFTDFPIRTPNTDCIINCECKEFIYLNEPNAMAVHKLEVVPGQVNLVEVTNNGGFWYPGTGTSELPNPHGLTFDLNGNLYIAETGENLSNIRRLNCAAEIDPIDTFAIVSATKQNMFVIGEFIYTNADQGPIVYDICDQDFEYQGCLADAAGNPTSNRQNLWGLSYNPVTNLIYATSRLFFRGEGQPTLAGSNVPPASRSLVWVFTPEEYEAAAMAGTCIQPFLTEGNTDVLVAGNRFTPNDNGSLMGITSDNLGNFYIVKSRLESGGVTSGAKILKYDATGAFVTQSLADQTGGDGGYASAIGIVWSPTTNKLYVSDLTGNPVDDCVSKFDAVTLTYEGTALPNPPSGGAAAKAITLVTECCPESTNTQVNIIRCVASTEEVVFLNELIECDGIICEGLWEEVSSDAEVDFDNCADVVSVTATGGCGVYTKRSAGGGALNQCGAFEITVFVEFIIQPDITISADQDICSGTAASTLTSTNNTTTTPAAYQWQMSTSGCNGPWTNITNATAATYTPGVLTQTTNYRLVTTNDTDCAARTCVDTSNCVTITVFPEATVEAGANQEACDDNTTVTLAGSFGGAASSATWVGGNGTFNPNRSTLNATYTPTSTEVNSGSITLNLQTNDPGGPCPRATDQVMITYFTLPTVEAGSNRTVCENSPAITLAGSFGGGASSAIWVGGNGTFNPGRSTLNASYTPTTAEIDAGSVTLTLETDDPTGPCSSVSDQLTITYFDLPTVEAGPNQEACDNSPTVTLAGSIDGSASSATWVGGAGNFNPDRNTLNATYTPSAGELAVGTITLTLETNNPPGPCPSVSDQVTINYFVLPTVEAGPNQEACDDSPTVTLAGSFGGGATSAAWVGGAGTFDPNRNT
ncbi:MAG: hypothetical protein AAF828_07200, partial [Bacteroidota bacterium]